MKTKEQLQKELNRIIEREHKDAVEKEFPKLKNMEGKFFKVRNSYGHGKNWTLYSMVKKVRKQDLYRTASGISAQVKMFCFETDCYGKIFISTENGYIHAVGKEISKAEFYEAYRVMMNSIKGML